MTVSISGTGGVTFNDSSVQDTAATGFGLKNRIINGLMTTDQRNATASQTFTAAGALAYSVDRWYGFCTGANVTGQQVAGATTPTNTQFRYRFTGAASVATVGFGQRIEQKNSYDLAGSTCTLSADLAISATLTTVTWTASYATTTADTFGTLASPTITQIATGTFTVSATVTNFSTNITVPAAATTGIQIVFTIGALTAGLTWTIGNVQLEKGSTATAFDYRPFGTELQLAQRYFYKASSTGGNVPFGFGYNTATTETAIGVPFPIVMRSIPTFTSSAANTFLLQDTANRVPTAVTMQCASVSFASIPFTTSGVTTGNGAKVLDNNTSANLSFSAEL